MATLIVMVSCFSNQWILNLNLHEYRTCNILLGHNFGSCHLFCTIWKSSPLVERNKLKLATASVDSHISSATAREIITELDI